jgi:hypothetical protein
MTTMDEAIKALRAHSTSVPDPASLPTAAEVDAMERQVGTRFHPDFRRFLLEASDVSVGHKEPATITEPQSHTHLPDVVASARECGVPNDLFPFCEDNADFFCLTEDGRVCYWSHDGETEEEWPSLAAWIEEVWLGEQ